jgi:hypothetical protein
VFVVVVTQLEIMRRCATLPWDTKLGSLPRALPGPSFVSVTQWWRYLDI